MKHQLSNTFGKKRVSSSAREKLVRNVFSQVATRYDLMNDLMSLGVHRLWKWRFCREVSKAPGQIFVDLACGTGDIARSLVQDNRKQLLVDACIEMIKLAQHRLGERCVYIAATAENLPLQDDSVDVLTISFGIRNTTDIFRSLQEITRVLKPGGYFYCLEFSEPSTGLRPFYNAWSRMVIPRLGALVAGHPDAYRYLIESIREFPAQQEMLELIQASGLCDASYSNLSFGIACIHRARKPLR